MSGACTDKSNHLGRAGQFAVMAELLARGWNVSVPEVDVGDDVFVARDGATELTRVQVIDRASAWGADIGRWRNDWTGGS